MLMQFKGEFSLGRYRRVVLPSGEVVPGELISEASQHNVVEPSGRAIFADLVSGASSAVYNQSTGIKIFNSGGSEVRALNTAFAAPTHDPSGTTGGNHVRWEWRDLDNVTYQATTIRTYNSNGAGTHFNTSTVNFGTKPADEIWIYRFTLTLEDSGGGDGVLSAAGLRQMLRRFTGQQANPFTASWVTARVLTNASGGSYIDLDSVSATRVNAGGFYRVDLLFNSEPGSNTGVWQDAIVRHTAVNEGVGYADFWQGNPVPSDSGKSASTKREWTLRLLF
jgi:hypothetical protein